MDSQLEIQPNNSMNIDSKTYDQNVNFNMKAKIWRVFVQILYYRNDLADIIKPFFNNLKNENMNDDKYFPLLKTFSKYQLEVLYQKRIITEEKLELLKINLKESPNQSSSQSTSDNPNDDLEEIISGDKVKMLDEFIQKNDIKAFNTITKSFKEVKKMKIPIIQYCIMKRAVECFKFLLVNGFDNPNKTMEEQNRNTFFSDQETKRYKWDSLATAIYFGNKGIIKILEEKGIEKGKKLEHIEAAILSYRNEIAEEIVEEMNENYLNIVIFSSARNNNIKGTEIFIKKGAAINITGNSITLN